MNIGGIWLPAVILTMVADVVLLALITVRYWKDKRIVTRLSFKRKKNNEQETSGNRY